MADGRRNALPVDLFDPPVDADDHRRAMRVAEALIFASAEPLDDDTIAAKLPEGADLRAVLDALVQEYAPRGVQLRRIAGKWMFRTAEDLAGALRDETVERRKLTRAQLETLAIIAYEQPVTRAEIEEVRGVATAKGTLDVLLETGWVRMRGRRKTPGRPITYGTTEGFLVHFGLDAIRDLPGLDELRGAGLLDARLPPGFAIPSPSDDATLLPDEDPLEPGDVEEEPLDPGVDVEADVSDEAPVASAPQRPDAP